MLDIDHHHQPSHVMGIRTNTQRAEWDWLDDLGPQAPNSYDSFVVRAPKLTLRSTKTVRKSTSTCTLAAQHPQVPKAASWHAPRASGWGLVGWDEYRIAHSGMIQS